MKRIVALLLALVMALAVVGCGKKEEAPAPEAENTAPYTIGVAVPLTGAGSSAGKMEHVGVTMAVNEINAAGGINGRELAINLVDTAGDPTWTDAPSRDAPSPVGPLATARGWRGCPPHLSTEPDSANPPGLPPHRVELGATI